jgi:hypothetical protein
VEVSLSNDSAFKAWLFESLRSKRSNTMVLRRAIRGLAALLAISIPLSVSVFAFAGPKRWIPLTEAEMTSHRGSMAERGKFTDNCTHYQAIKGINGSWSCISRFSGGCDKCEVTQNITYADMGGNPKLQKDGAAQDCGRRSQGALCVNQLCTGNNWDPEKSCAQPATSINQ